MWQERERRLQHRWYSSSTVVGWSRVVKSFRLKQRKCFTRWPSKFGCGEENTSKIHKDSQRRLVALVYGDLSEGDEILTWTTYLLDVTPSTSARGRSTHSVHVRSESGRRLSYPRWLREIFLPRSPHYQPERGALSLPVVLCACVNKHHWGRLHLMDPFRLPFS